SVPRLLQPRRPAAAGDIIRRRGDRRYPLSEDQLDLGSSSSTTPGQILFGVGPAAQKVTLGRAGKRIAQSQRCLPKSLLPDGEGPRVLSGRPLRNIFSICAPSSEYRSRPTWIGMAPNTPSRNRPGRSAILSASP